MTLIDHYDSFTFNVIEWLAAGDPQVEVRYVAWDDADAMARLSADPTPLVLSPGPKRPEDAASTLALAQKCLGRVPILGVCLGHQILGLLAGATVERSSAPFHGTTRAIRVHPSAAHRPGLLQGLEEPFQAAVYHSLVVRAEAPSGSKLSNAWEVAAVDDLDEVAALQRLVPGEAPAFGVQFHPESYLSERATELRANWLQVTIAWELGRA